MAMRSKVRRRPDGVIQILPPRASATIAAEAGVLLGFFGACAGFLAMLTAELIRHPMSVALAGSCLVFGLTTVRWVSTGEVLPASLAHQGREAESTGPHGSPPPFGGPKGAA
jgi:hypothetical protein